MSRRLLFSAAVVIVAVLVGCGSQSTALPSGVAVRVGVQSITVAEMQHWMVIAAHQQTGATGATGASTGTLLPDAPKFSACIANGRTQNVAAEKKTAATAVLSTAQLRGQCQQAYDAIRNQVVGLLVSAAWVAQTDAARHLPVTSAQVSSTFASQLKASFPTSSAFATYLASSGMSVTDILVQVRNALLTAKLQAAITVGAAPPSAAEARSYYQSHLASYGQVEKRDLLIIQVKTAAAAAPAQAALSAGQSWAAVAKKYSEDTALNKTGGRISGVTSTNLDPELSKVVFAAPVGVLTGPSKSLYGYFLFQVTAVVPATQQSYSQARAAVVKVLLAQRQQTLLNAFTVTWKKAQKAKTVCAPAYMLASVCGNAPKAKK